MELPSGLNNEIVDFLKSIPNIHSGDNQRALIYQADLDTRLQDQISFGQPPAFFIPLLVVALGNYGRLSDGRDALEAVLESAKIYVGKEKQDYCDKLIRKLRSYLEKLAADRAESAEQEQPTARSATSYVQIILEGDITQFNKTKHKDFITVIAALLEIDQQCIRILHAHAGSIQLVIQLPTDKARQLAAMFHAHREKFAPLRKQFFVKLVAVLNVLREIALLSDLKLLPEAEQFVAQFLEHHPAITKKDNPITPTQINGLENYLSSAETTQLLEQYIGHQKTKAKRNENPTRKNKEYYLGQYYERLEMKVEELRRFISQHAEIFPDFRVPAQERWYHYCLVKEFVQHLIADYNFRIQSH